MLIGARPIGPSRIAAETSEATKADRNACTVASSGRPRIAAAVPQWRKADVWFCGPAAFGQALRRDLLALGLPAEQFHQELFQMR